MRVVKTTIAWGTFITNAIMAQLFLIHTMRSKFIPPLVSYRMALGFAMTN
jgi:hypothetical protein